MFTSVISDRRTYFNCFDAARLYVLAAVNVAVFSAIYEYFSFGVYSPFMIFAFAVPLLMGGLAFLLLGKACKKTGTTVPALACKFWHAAAATLTTGFLFRGVLDIYGTSSSLGAVYWTASAVLAALALLILAITSCWR
ncbi:MAG: hypothetical protein J6A42_05815 [Firmicutes bacterium]|nr:hypothetical protein [Bacillota bacterium]